MPNLDDVVVKIKADVSDFTSGIEEGRVGLEGLRSEAEKTQGSFESLGANDLTKSLRDVAPAVGDVVGQLKELSTATASLDFGDRAADSMAETMKRLREEFEAQQRVVADLVAGGLTYDQALAQVANDAELAENAARALAAATQEAANAQAQAAAEALALAYAEKNAADRAAELAEKQQELAKSAQDVAEFMASAAPTMGELAKESGDAAISLGNLASSMTDVGPAAEQLSLFGKDAGVAFADASGQLNLFTDSLEPIGATASGAAAGFGQLNESVANYGAKAAEMSAVQAKLDQEFVEAIGALAEIKIAYDNGAASAQLLAKAQEEAERAFKASGRTIQETSSTFGKFAEGVGDFIEHPLKSAGEAAKSFLLALGPVGTIAIGVGTGIAELAHKIGELVAEEGAAAEQTMNMAARLNLSFEETKKLATMAEFAGINIGVLSRVSMRLSDAMNDSSKSGKKVAEALEELGVEADESGSMMLPLLKRLSEIPGATERISAAHKIMGQGAVALEPLLRNYNELKKAVESLGGELSGPQVAALLAADDASDRLSETFKRLKENLAAAFAPQYKEAVELLIKIFDTPKVETFDSQLVTLRMHLVEMEEAAKKGTSAIDKFLLALLGLTANDDVTNKKIGDLKREIAEIEKLNDVQKAGAKEGADRSREYNAILDALLAKQKRAREAAEEHAEALKHTAKAAKEARDKLAEFSDELANQLSGTAPAILSAKGLADATLDIGKKATAAALLIGHEHDAINALNAIAKSTTATLANMVPSQMSTALKGATTEVDLLAAAIESLGKDSSAAMKKAQDDAIDYYLILKNNLDGVIVTAHDLEIAWENVRKEFGLSVEKNHTGTQRMKTDIKEVSETVRQLKSTFEGLAGRVADALVGSLFDTRANKQLQESIRGLNGSLAEAAAKWADVQREAAQALREIVADHAKAAKEIREDANRSFRDATIDYKRFVEDAIEDLRKAQAKGDMEEVAQIQKQMRRRKEDYDLYVADLKQATNKKLQDNQEAQQKETDAVNKSLEEQRTAYNKFVADTQAKIVELTAQIKNAFERMADAVKNVLVRIGQDILSILIEGALKKLGKAILDNTDLFGGLGKAAKDAAGATSGVTGGAAKAGTGAVSGIGGIVNVVTGAVSAVSDVIANFQFYAMNKSLDIIVKHTLETTNEIRNLRNDAWLRQTFLAAQLEEIAQLLGKKAEPGATKTDALLESIRATVQSQTEQQARLDAVARAQAEHHNGGIIAFLGGLRDAIHTWGEVVQETFRNIFAPIVGIAKALGDIVGGFIGSTIGGIGKGIAGIGSQSRMENDIAKIEVTTRGILNEMLNLRRDLWDQQHNLFVKLDDMWNEIRLTNSILSLIEKLSKSGGETVNVEEGPGTTAAEPATTEPGTANTVGSGTAPGALDNVARSGGLATDSLANVSVGADNSANSLYNLADSVGSFEFDLSGVNDSIGNFNTTVAGTLPALKDFQTTLTTYRGRDQWAQAAEVKARTVAGNQQDLQRAQLELSNVRNQPTDPYFYTQAQKNADIARLTRMVGQYQDKLTQSQNLPQGNYVIPSTPIPGQSAIDYSYSPYRGIGEAGIYGTYSPSLVPFAPMSNPFPVAQPSFNEPVYSDQYAPQTAPGVNNTITINAQTPDERIIARTVSAGLTEMAFRVR